MAIDQIIYYDYESLSRCACRHIAAYQITFVGGDSPYVPHFACHFDLNEVANEVRPRTKLLRPGPMPLSYLISPQAQPQPPTQLTVKGKASISAGRQETFRLKLTSINTPSIMPGNKSELGG